MVQNEINNLGFLTGEAKTKMSKVNDIIHDITFGVNEYNILDIANVMISSMH